MKYLIVLILLLAPQAANAQFFKTYRTDLATEPVAGCVDIMTDHYGDVDLNEVLKETTVFQDKGYVVTIKRYTPLDKVLSVAERKKELQRQLDELKGNE